MTVFDKAQWHIDGGEQVSTVVNKFEATFRFLDRHGLLNEDGKEILELGIDSSVSLHENLVTTAGAKFLSENYDKAINELPENLESRFEMLYNQK